MDSYFELFDLASGNVIEDYECERDAIAALVDVVLNHGIRVIGTFALTRVQSGQPTLIAMEDDLVRLVEREMSQLAANR
jgi:hypothetical protein